MITFVKGILSESLPTRAVVDVGGMGYEVLIPLSSFEKLPDPGQAVHLHTHLAVREDAHVLYGFASLRERELFRLLITVSGIGPRMALNVLSGMRPADFQSAVIHGDIKGLSSISGIGKKTAERIVVELKDKVGPVVGSSKAGMPDGGALAGDSVLEDAVQAIMALGSKPADARKMVEAARALLGESAHVEQLVRAVLKGKG